MGEAKEVLLLQMSRDHRRKYRFNIFQCFFFEGGDVSIVMREEGKKVKHEENSQKFLFGHILKKRSIYTLFGAWSLLLIHVQFTPSQGPKAFKTIFS